MPDNTRKVRAEHHRTASEDIRVRLGSSAAWSEDYARMLAAIQRHEQLADQLDPPTFETSDVPVEVSNVIRAWKSPGPNPRYHERMKSRVSANMPVLYHSLEALVRRFG